MVFVRYWGSHFKSARRVQAMAGEFRALIDRGWGCALVVERHPEDPAWLALLASLGVHVEVVPRPCAGLGWQVVWRARQLCKRLHAAIVVCDNIHTSPLLGATLAGVPVRCWFKRSMSPAYEEIRAPTLRERVRIGERLSCALATRVFAVSQPVKDELVRLGSPKRKIVVRHNPRPLIDVGQAQDRDSARQRWGFADQEVVVGTVGHAVPVKGWDILVRAFAQVVVADPRARLLLVGSYQAPHEQATYRQLKTWVDGHGLSDKVRFAGHLGDVASALRAMDVFAFPSRSEGCPNALIEALEAGLPCVCSRVGNAPEVIRPEVNGLLVERGHLDSLAEGLVKLVREDALRARYAHNAAVPSCIPTLEEYAEQLASDYEVMLRERRPRAEVRGQRTEDGGRKTEDRSQRPAILARTDDGRPQTALETQGSATGSAATRS